MWLALALSLLTSGSPVSPEKAAKVRFELEKAQKTVDEKYGKKKSSELTQAERREMIRDQAEAEQKVLDKHGLDAKSWARQSMTMDRDQAAEQKALTKQLEEAEKAAEKAAAEKAQAQPAEIPIQRGSSEADPMVMVETRDAPPRVDTTLPGSAQDEFNEAGGATNDEASTEAPKATKRRGKRR